MKQPPKSALQNAERFGGYAKQALVDAEDAALRAEFVGLDLTEAEQANLAEGWRLRRSGASNAERIASRSAFARVRLSLEAAVEATVRHEQRAATDLASALVIFERDELRRRERHEVALLRPSTDLENEFHHASLKDLAETAGARRQAIVDSYPPSGQVSRMPRSGALRIHSRDGLAELHSRRRITDAQFAAGLAYRQRIEAVSRGLRSCLGGEVGGRSGNPGQIADMASRTAKWERQRIRCDVAVIRAMQGNGRALSLLRRVAGEGWSVTSQVGSGRANAAAIKVLANALNLVAGVLSIF